MEREPQPQPDRQAIIHDMTVRIMQQIIAESPYKPDMEWTIWLEADHLEQHNQLPEGITANEVLAEYHRFWEGE